MPLRAYKNAKVTLALKLILLLDSTADTQIFQDQMDGQVERWGCG